MRANAIRLFFSLALSLTLTACKADPPTCTDGKKNAEESDIDCGGGFCSPCSIGKLCANSGDCDTGACMGTVCVAATCTDNSKNGMETDVDCGGSCAPCGDAKKCTNNADCASANCSAGTCAAASCTDMLKNGTESDVDCGGSCATKCADAKNCVAAADCQSGICTAGRCVAASCNDMVKNGTETDVDCGGSCMAKCADTKGCTKAADCTSGVCTANKCAVPTCTDMVQNSKETDVDCGGGTCAKCALGKTCIAAADCVSGACVAGKCASIPTDCASNPKWQKVTCTTPSWVWSRNRAFTTVATAAANKVLATGCKHGGPQPDLGNGVCSLNGQGYVSTATFVMSGCDTTWYHLGGSYTGNCGGHDGDTWRHFSPDANSCYDY